MKDESKDIDRLIKETLSTEEAKFYDELGEQNLLEMVEGLYKTKNRWFIIIMNIVSFMALAILTVCIVNFVSASTTNELITWAVAGFIAMSFIIMLKLYSWMQMDKNALLREMKRLELQISSLVTKIDEK
ncbi:DUF6768 family protein [Aquimarina brevivitae]|uniref:Uncharacterized protein n=1 Tax=Aquimarina brevivitae TaxID=323412 RepID=A0A4Q7NTT4_9FLAO|nr:DUF6768 family protein [Aquimarina brevivitae]RZS90434.1 hypothetical protein EV197_3419 [Aquimarina brevivitae]